MQRYRRRSTNARSLLVLRVMRGQRRAFLQCMLFWLYVNANCANTENILCSRKNCRISIKPPSTKVAQTLTTCDLHTSLSELLKRPLSKTSALTGDKFQRQLSIFWQSCNYDTWSRRCQTRLKSSAPFFLPGLYLVCAKNDLQKTDKYRKILCVHVGEMHV